MSYVKKQALLQHWVLFSVEKVFGQIELSFLMVCYELHIALILDLQNKLILYTNPPKCNILLKDLLIKETLLKRRMKLERIKHPLSR